jgi:hypothetical protein
MSATPPQYEFNQGQNAFLIDLSNKMRGVGFIWRLVGLLGLGLAALIGYRAYQHYQWNFPPEVWAALSGHAFVGLFNLLIGGWTLSASASFRQIASTEGRDMSHLMNGLRSLYQMFALIYTLMVLAIILFLVSLGLAVYSVWQGNPPPV